MLCPVVRYDLFRYLFERQNTLFPSSWELYSVVYNKCLVIYPMGCQCFGQGKYQFILNASVI